MRRLESVRTPGLITGSRSLPGFTPMVEFEPSVSGPV